MADAPTEPIREETNRTLIESANWVVFTQPGIEYDFYFMPNGEVTLMTTIDGRTTLRVFTYANGRWDKENFNG